MVQQGKIIWKTWEPPNLWLTEGSKWTDPISPLPNFPLVSLSHHLTSDSYLHSFLSCQRRHGKHSLLCCGTSQTKQGATISSYSELVMLMKQHCPTFLVLWQLYLAWAPDLDSTSSSSFGKMHHILLGATKGKHILFNTPGWPKLFPHFVILSIYLSWIWSNKTTCGLRDI